MTEKLMWPPRAVRIFDGLYLSGAIVFLVSVLYFRFLSEVTSGSNSVHTFISIAPPTQEIHQLPEQKSKTIEDPSGLGENLRLLDDTNVSLGILWGKSNADRPRYTLIRRSSNGEPVISESAIEAIGLSEEDQEFVKIAMAELWKNGIDLINNHVEEDPLRKGDLGAYRFATPEDKFMKLLSNFEEKIRTQFEPQKSQEILSSFNWIEHLDAPGHVEISFQINRRQGGRIMINWKGIDPQSGRVVLGGDFPRNAFLHRFGVDIDKL